MPTNSEYIKDYCLKAYLKDSWEQVGLLGIINPSHIDNLTKPSSTLHEKELEKMKNQPEREDHLQRICMIPEKIIFSEPATIVLWEDGTKTVVKCSPRDTFDKEKGIALCFMKKLLGNKGAYNDTFKKWIKDEEAAE